MEKLNSDNYQFGRKVQIVYDTIAGLLQKTSMPKGIFDFENEKYYGILLGKILINSSFVAVKILDERFKNRGELLGYSFYPLNSVTKDEDRQSKLDIRDSTGYHLFECTDLLYCKSDYEIEE